MLSDDLYSLFRSDMNDALAPYLWSDTEVYTYMNDAYRMFVRLTGGIPDSTSSVTQVGMVANQQTSTVSPLILRFLSAYLLSDNTELKITNERNMPRYFQDDYGITPVNYRDLQVGAVRYMVVGTDRNHDGGIVKWFRIPAANDIAQLSVMRLPLDTVTGPGFDFYEIGEEHHIWLMDWMRARAYNKQDAETYNRGRSQDYEKSFRAYCVSAKAEWDRYRSHSHSVVYGGL